MEPPADPMDMPGAVQVTLQPGETVFYNNNILHCATYDDREERITLHACMGEVRGGPTRARNILQHGLEWMKGDTFRDTLDERGRRMLERIVKLQESVNRSLKHRLDSPVLPWVRSLHPPVARRAGKWDLWKYRVLRVTGY